MSFSKRFTDKTLKNGFIRSNSFQVVYDIKEIIGTRLSKRILEISTLAGGDINDVYLVRTSARKYVVKCNKKESFPQMFLKEARGLEALKKTVNTPKVIDVFEHEGDQLLILDYVQEERSTLKYWKNFSHDLASLHKVKSDYFGLEYDNYIGSLKQINKPQKSWVDFFISCRLQPLIKIAFDKQLLGAKHSRGFERFFLAYPDLVPIEKPSLLHGDLWSGNLLCSTGAMPFFIDPAVYYGHREMDISMTRLFGGFDKRVIDHYNEVFPLEKNWENRIPIHNLYPNLVHLVLFGKAYLSGIERVIKDFS